MIASVTTRPNDDAAALAAFAREIAVALKVPTRGLTLRDYAYETHAVLLEGVAKGSIAAHQDAAEAGGCGSLSCTPNHPSTGA